mmetsp:Transcript_36010/g.84427  ORF Transcript_36010/g.84427 Transcript_36010/m.84427 type:complete len:239 (+) Transcript_36010:96-812(+)|eukprot:CAMPEP_0178418974 /NCGR_PEP_ID=MMETSP0689_2-20121128/25365_1 /TAXON_ID=160604 /ORGANISM="Amphidinium massartii, Strain CS-259" /LENGTH=238 /DNA_ID=CAMNT_0020040385 /DNA_START=8 /DNA_END=724 /DNA_ORIENTATION=+
MEEAVAESAGQPKTVQITEPEVSSDGSSAGDDETGEQSGEAMNARASTASMMDRMASSFSERGKRRTSLGLHGTISVPAKAGLSEQRVQELREVFSLFDTEGSGRIVPSFVREAALDVGLDQRNPDVWRMLEGLKTEEDEGVDFEEFIQLVTEPLGDHFTRSGTGRLLNLIGPNAAILGSVGVADLQAMVDELGLEMDEDDLVEMLIKAGSGTDGRLMKDAFDKVMRNPEEDGEAEVP